MAAFRHVLIADDEASIRHVLTLVLTESGYEVRAVADGDEALKELAARSYDVVISDVRMPKVDGIALMKQALATNPELTFLVMSAYGSKDLALEAVAQGAYDFIEKPFKPEEIVFILKKAEERLRLVRENRRLRGEPPPDGPLQHQQSPMRPMLCPAARGYAIRGYGIRNHRFNRHRLATRSIKIRRNAPPPTEHGKCTFQNLPD